MPKVTSIDIVTGSMFCLCYNDFKKKIIILKMEQEEERVCITCLCPKKDNLYNKKCYRCYAFERNRYYQVKKLGKQELIYINNAINLLRCCHFLDNVQHKNRIKDVIQELNNIID